MTPGAFIIGVVPLELAERAGAEMRRTLGSAVFAGMLGVTAFGQSGDLDSVHRYHGLDTDSIVGAALDLVD